MHVHVDSEYEVCEEIQKEKFEVIEVLESPQPTTKARSPPKSTM